MTDYRCPAHIADHFATEELAASKGRWEYVEWLASLPLKRGDRVEVFNEDLKGMWWEYAPNN